MPCLGMRLDFHAVGQGLFASGELIASRHCFRPYPSRRPLLRWVYDCGTRWGQKPLNDEIDYYLGRQLEQNQDPKQKPSIDLVAVSHFDKDHISGVIRLLHNINVKILLLPYVPLHLRLIAGFRSGVSENDPLFQFYLNPVTYIASLDGIDVEEVVFVPPSEDGAAPPPEDPPQGGDLNIADPEPLKFPRNDAPSGTEEERLLTDDTNATFLQPGGTLSTSIWEFVPYNDQSLIPDKDSEFWEKVEELRDQLIDSPSDEILTDLKNAYDNEFSRNPKNPTGEERNIISLHLYGGLLHGYATCLCDYCPHLEPSTMVNVESLTKKGRSQTDFDRRKTGFLYTGDGFLATPLQLVSLLKYLGRNRFDNFNCLQIMHHGSEKNWQRGLAAALDPECSIFSSEPTVPLQFLRGEWGAGLSK